MKAHDCETPKLSRREVKTNDLSLGMSLAETAVECTIVFDLKAAEGIRPYGEILEATTTRRA
jgi:hypothetical protein